MEEEVGFEPTVRSSRTTVFKTAPINRSGTPPFSSIRCNFIVSAQSLLSIIKFKIITTKLFYKKKLCTLRCIAVD